MRQWLAGKVISVQIEQRVNLNFLAKLEKPDTKVYDMLKEVRGHKYFSRTQVFDWFEIFKERRDSTEVNARHGPPLTPASKNRIPTF